MANSKRRVLSAVTGIVGLVAVHSVESAGADPKLTHIRTDNDRIAEVIRYARKTSPSFEDLVATFEMLDRVTYIEEGHCRHREQRACLQLMPTTGLLLVRIDPRQPIRLVAAQLAHELYHALEIARDPDVVDVASLRHLYDRIGERSCFIESDDCWDTRAAVTFEALVTRELTAARPPSKPHSSGR